MARKFIFGVSICLCLASLVVAVPSRSWTPSSWTTEQSPKAGGWDKTEVGYSTGDDSKGKGWVSSENAEPSYLKSIPTSWQKIERHHGNSVKSGGWKSAAQKSAVNPPAQEIAQGFVVRHPVPSTEKWSQSPISADAWNSQSSPVEYWPSDTSQKSAPQAGWEKAVAEEQWQQKQPQVQEQHHARLQTPEQHQGQSQHAPLDSSSTWEKTSSAQSPSAWSKDTYRSSWDKSARSDRESAAGYAATGPAQYRSDSTTSWDEKPSTSGWAKDSSSSPAAWNSDPAKWDGQAPTENSDWQNNAPSNGWDASPNYKTWQANNNGWTTYDVTYETKPITESSWQKLPSAAPPNTWQDNAVSNGWEKTLTAPANAWDKNTPKKTHASTPYKRV